MRQGRRGQALITTGIVVTALLLPIRSALATVGSGTTTASSATGVTSTTVTVAGVVGTDPASVGADIGAQARFARHNRGSGTHRRTVRYLRTEGVSDAATADAAVARVATDAFAAVPVVAPVGASALGTAGIPFFGAADTVDWYTNRTGFGFTGVAVSDRARTASSPLGVQLRTLMGGNRATVVVFHDDSASGAVRAAEAGRSLRAAGFRGVTLIAVALPPASFTAVTLGSAPTSGAAVFLTSTARTVDIVHQLVAAGSTATLVVGPEFYAPTNPAVANGLTVLTSVAPFEEQTRANRRLAADLESFAPGTVATPAIAAGYWSADLFLRGVAAAGKDLTRRTLLDAMNGEHFTFEVAGTVGRSTWPEMHAQPVPCGSLVQSDGTRYLVMARYRCAPARTPR